MNRLLVFITYILFSCSSSFAFQNELFRLNRAKSDVVKQAVMIESDKDFSIPVGTKGVTISGLSVDCSITKVSEDYLVRVILVDNQDKEYLVLEAYKEIFDDLNLEFSDYCEETKILQNVHPNAIKVVVTGANVSIKSVSYDTTSINKMVGYSNTAEIRKRQVKSIVDRINAYNKSNDKLWYAGVTPLSLKDYQERKRVMSLDDHVSSHGMEYYSDGIFEMGTLPQGSQPYRSDVFADEFTWTNRHGENWMTPSRDQGITGSCVLFTTIGCLEGLTNLYYNTHLDFDLSEQEITCCTGLPGIPNKTGVSMGYHTMSNLLGYIASHGVCDELAYPFVNDTIHFDCMDDVISPNEIVRISGYGSVPLYDDSLKKALISHGPLISGYKWKWPDNPNHPSFDINHASTLVGYGKLHVGDTIYHYVDSLGFKNGAYTVREGDPRVGRTYWIYKSSYGAGSDEPHGGYMWLIHYNNSLTMNNTYYCQFPIVTTSRSVDDIVCEDKDGDGLYNWGIGPKPMSAQWWVSDCEDGDDSDINKGIMDAYGNIEQLANGITIADTLECFPGQTIDYRIGIVSGGVLKIISDVCFSDNGKIRNCENGTLIVDGACLNNANLELVPGSRLVVRNNGEIHMATGTHFECPKGAILEIENGTID